MNDNSTTNETSSKPSKPSPINLSSIKPPENTASFPTTSLDQYPHKIIIKLVGDVIEFEVPNGEQAAKFMDSITAICNSKQSIARLGIGAELYVIPTEKIIYTKLLRPQISR